MHLRAAPEFVRAAFKSRRALVKFHPPFTLPSSSLRAYDRTALILRGKTASINFPHAEYEGDEVLAQLRGLSTKKQVVAAIRRTQDQEVREGCLQAGPMPVRVRCVDGIAWGIIGLG